MHSFLATSRFYDVILATAQAIHSLASVPLPLAAPSGWHLSSPSDEQTRGRDDSSVQENCEEVFSDSLLLCNHDARSLFPRKQDPSAD